MNNLYSNRRGSVLLEALLSVIILSVSLTVIIQAMTSSLRAATFSAQYTQAIILLDNQMSEMMKDGMATAHFHESGRFEAPFDNFEYSYTTKDYKDLLYSGAESIPDLNEASMVVSWGSDKKNKKINIHTLLFDEN